MNNKPQNTPTNNTEFNGYWAVILGGSSGLGLATAKKLAAEGMNICIVHRDLRFNMPKFEEEVTKIKAFGVAVKTFNKDALKAEIRAEIIKELPKNSVKLLLHSIAKGSLKKMNTAEGEAITKEDIAITVHAMAISWYEWVQNMNKEKVFTTNARSIAFTSEGNSRVWPGYAAVSSAKSVLEALMRNMAVEYAPYNITSNCIQAGATETPSFLAIPGSEQLAEATKLRNPFNRLTTPEDVANAVYLLCKKEANWINGTILKADGGESLR